MRITCKMGTKNIKVVEVQPNDYLYILLKKLNISDKNTKFIFNGLTYCMGSLQTFSEIGLTSDARIAVYSNNSESTQINSNTIIPNNNLIQMSNSN